VVFSHGWPLSADARDAVPGRAQLQVAHELADRSQFFKDLSGAFYA